MTDLEPQYECYTCKGKKPKASFHRHAGRPNDKQTMCKVCRKAYNAEYYQRTKSLPSRDSGQKKVLQRVNGLILAAMSGGCVDCGISDLEVLEFDHLGDKVASIAKMRQTANTPKLMAELAKCQVVCANCHKKRTYARMGGTYRTKSDLIREVSEAINRRYKNEN